MKHNQFRDLLNTNFNDSKFSAELGHSGGTLTFSNSGQRGGVKYFTLSLESICSIFIDIQNNLSEFSSHKKYVEKEWRDLGSKYYNDGPANALSTVQTKPLFSTLSKILNIANNEYVDPDNEINLSDTTLTNTIALLKNLISEFTPTNTQPAITINTDLFKIDKFVQQAKDANLLLSSSLPHRFISALQTKPFVILTGLSGSGKTKLAEAFSTWITTGVSQSLIFRKSQEITASRAVYIIEDVDRLGVVIKSDGSTRSFLPFDLIKLWVEVIYDKGFDSNTPSQTIQEKVVEAGVLNYSTTLNSFHSVLRALAFSYIDSVKKQQADLSNNQTCMVAVGADWTNREPLLGFPNALEKGHYVKPESGVLDVILNASNDPQRPYFLILDEMNMSHVERYFADFLSAMESSSGEIALHPDTDDWAACDVPATICLPSNLFIIGTVNIDETTYMFSPKVLDRANVIEFRVSGDDMQGYFDAPSELNLESLTGAGASMASSFVAKANERGLMAEHLADALMPFFDQLSEVGAEFGYRTASEMSRFVKICGESAGDKMTDDEVIDSAIIQKLLPKLHGSRNKIEKVLTTLGGLCLANANKSTAPFNTDISDDDIKYPLSYEKLKRMHQRVLSDGFTSFAEA